MVDVFMNYKKMISRGGLALLCAASIFISGPNQRMIEEQHSIRPETIKDVEPFPEMKSLDRLVYDTSNGFREVIIPESDKETCKKYDSMINKSSLQEVIDSVKTPLDARFMVMSYHKRNTGTVEKKCFSPEDIHKNRVEFVCLHAAYMTARALDDNGFPPLILSVAVSLDKPNNKDNPFHAVFLYRYKGNFGMIDNHSVMAPVFDSIKHVVEYLSCNMGREYTLYRIRDISLESADWKEHMPSPDKAPYYEDVK